jgi:serine/threonine protein kinase/TolA-binding protein
MAEPVKEPESKRGTDGFKKKVDTTRLASGTKIGQYVILNEIDRGGMAVVYKARQLALDREVALKVLPPSVSIQGKFMDRFQKEAKSIAQLAHPNIVRIIEVGGDAGIYFIAMEFLDGLNLYKYMVKYEPTVYSVVQIIRQLSDALEYAHGRNIIHRDLKLNNVIMRDNSSPVLIDFGLAKAREADSGITLSGEILGSPSYMSPEQALGLHVDERTDIYSLGIMFYELMTGKNPYYDKRGYQQTIYNVIHGDVKHLREISDWIPRDVETIVLKCLEKDREKRYQTMRALRMDLERFQTGEPILARQPSLWERVSRNIKKRRGIYLFVLIILLMMGSFGVYYRYQMSLEKADWKIVTLTQDFYQNLDAEWTGERGRRSEPIKFLNMDSPWSGGENRIQVAADDYTWIAWKKTLDNEMQVNFTLTVNREQSREFGCFIHGNDPDGGYTFRFMDDEVYLTKESRGNIVEIARRRNLKKEGRFKIRVEKSDYSVRLVLNNKLAINFHDYTPLSGVGHGTFGFYVDNGGMTVSDVSVFKLGVPFKTRPIEAAERFFERGYYADAIEEYRNIASLYPNDPMAVHARFKVGLSLMMLKDYKAAVSEFESILRSKERDMLPQAMAQIAQCHSRMGRAPKADQMILNIRDKFPNSSAIINILSNFNNQILDTLRTGRLSARRAAGAKLEYLSQHFAAYGRLYMSAYLEYGQIFIEKRMYTRARKVFQHIEKNFCPQVDEAVMAKVRLADIKAYTGRLEHAIAAYNKILAAHHTHFLACAESWQGIGLINRALGKTDDAVKCYSYIRTEYNYLRKLSAGANLSIGLAYHEKEKPGEAAQKYFKRILTSYRDCDQEYWAARLLTREIGYPAFKRKFDLNLLDYYIGEVHRAAENYPAALMHYQVFRARVRGNALLTRLVDKQIAYVQ